jgi:hephaestin
MSMGTEVDLHTPHWHGNDVTVSGMRMDVVSLLPAGMVTADTVPPPDDPGPGCSTATATTTSRRAC